MAKKLWSALTSTVLLVPSLLIAQPTLESLWPNTDGLRWDYELTNESSLEPGYVTTASLQLLGTVETSGGTAQVLIANEAGHVPKARVACHDPLLSALWRARPDLRPAIQARYGVVGSGEAWSPLLLHGGYYMKGATNIQMWQPDSDHPMWTYLTDDLGVGATFTQQLIPELADDVYLYGTVEALDASVSTPAGTFSNAVRVHYRIDYGWAYVVDQSSTTTGRFRGETRGDVHYVPGIGPVAMMEELIPLLEVECYVPDCLPPDLGFELGRIEQTVSMSLLHLPVSITPQSWSQVKQLYRP